MWVTADADGGQSLHPQSESGGAIPNPTVNANVNRDPNADFDFDAGVNFDSNAVDYDDYDDDDDDDDDAMFDLVVVTPWRTSHVVAVEGDMTIRHVKLLLANKFRLGAVDPGHMAFRYVCVLELFLNQSKVGRATEKTTVICHPKA